MQVQRQCLRSAPVLRNQMTPLSTDSRVVLFRNILTPSQNISGVGRRLRDRKVAGSSPVYTLPRNNLGQVVLLARASVHQAV